MFELTFLSGLISSLSKSVFVAKFACASLAAKFSAVSLLNSGVVIYLSWSWSVIFFLISLIFVLQSVFLTRLLIFGISFSTVAGAVVVVAKLLIFGISPLTSFILVLRVVLVAKLVISGFLSSIFLMLTLYRSFLTTSFLTILLSLLKSTFYQYLFYQ